MEQNDSPSDSLSSVSLIKYDENPDVPLSLVSQSKYDTLGTEEKVREQFQLTFGTLPSSIKNKEHVVKAAKDHYDDMKKRTVCKLPLPKIVRVEEVYPDVHKIYHPACTIIHQCSDESGCCHSKDMKCTAASTENVTLYFIVISKTTNSRGRPQVTQSYEGLSFINHTLCECQPEFDRITRSISSVQSPFMETAPNFQNLSYMKKCPLPCPSLFMPKFMTDGTCVCECNGDGICQKYKRGQRTFNFYDHYCLFTNRCTSPNCAYGDYLTKLSRCPKKFERRRD